MRRDMLALIIAGVLLSAGLLGLIDYDEDGLDTHYELFASRTGPWNKDHDADGLGDGLEVREGFDPRRSDPDQDGLRDDAEYVAGTDPFHRDSDRDTLDDLLETQEGTDPTDADSDDDLLDDAQERLRMTDPLDPDSDDDGILDGPEVDVHHTDPLDADSDDDGLIDGDEAHIHRTDPLQADTDNDRLGDLEEITLGTHPLDPDSDGDSLPDGAEVYDHRTDPRRADTDLDGLDDPTEIDLESDPRDPDSDDDGLKDGDEPLACLFLFDCDEDTVPDGVEVAMGLDIQDPTTVANLLDATLVQLDLASPAARADTDSDGIPDGLEETDVLDWGPFSPKVGRTDYFVEMVRQTTPETGPVDMASFGGAYSRVADAVSTGGVHMQWTETRIRDHEVPRLFGQDEFLAAHGDRLLSARNPFVHVVLLVPAYQLEMNLGAGVSGWAGMYDQHGLVVYGTHLFAELEPAGAQRHIQLFPQQCMLSGDCGTMVGGYDLPTRTFNFTWYANGEQGRLDWQGWLIDDVTGTLQRAGTPDAPIGITRYLLAEVALADTILHEIGHNMGLCHTHTASCYQRLPAEEQPLRDTSTMSYGSDFPLSFLPSEWERFRAQLACGHNGNLNALTLGGLSDYRFTGTRPDGDAELFGPRRCT